MDGMSPAHGDNAVTDRKACHPGSYFGDVAARAVAQWSSDPVSTCLADVMQFGARADQTAAALNEHLARTRHRHIDLEKLCLSVDIRENGLH
jgi:hypothetical protein